MPRLRREKQEGGAYKEGGRAGARPPAHHPAGCPRISPALRQPSSRASHKQQAYFWRLASWSQDPLSLPPALPPLSDQPCQLWQHDPDACAQCTTKVYPTLCHEVLAA